MNRPFHLSTNEKEGKTVQKAPKLSPIDSNISELKNMEDKKAKRKKRAELLRINHAVVKLQAVFRAVLTRKRMQNNSKKSKQTPSSNESSDNDVDVDIDDRNDTSGNKGQLEIKVLTEEDNSATDNNSKNSKYIGHFDFCIVLPQMNARRKSFLDSLFRTYKSSETHKTFPEESARVLCHKSGIPPYIKEKLDDKSLGIVEKLLSSGFYTYLFLSKDIGEDDQFVFCLFRSSLNELTIYAYKINFEMQCDPETLAELGKNYCPQNGKKKLTKIMAPIANPNPTISVSGNELVTEVTKQRTDSKAADSSDAVHSPRVAYFFDMPYFLDSKSPEKLASDKDNPMNEFIPHDPSITKLTPFENIYLKFETFLPYLDHHLIDIYKVIDKQEIKDPFEFESEVLEANNIEKIGEKKVVSNKPLYVIPKGMTHPFRSSVRLRLTKLMLEDKLHGCGLDINGLIRNGIIKGYFPLVDESKREELAVKWFNGGVKSWFRPQPLEDIREYFGSKLTLYFAFLGHYNMYLLLPAIFGLIVQIVVFTTGDRDHPLIAVFAVFISIYMMIMIRTWKEVEYRFALESGTSNFEMIQPNRSEFVGEKKPDIITGKSVVYFAPSTKRFRIRIALSIIFCLILCVIGSVASIYILRSILYRSIGTSAQAVASIVNTIQIMTFSYIYNYVAIYLNNWENHRTDTEFSDFLISKLFAFGFINSFASYFYIAFVAGELSPEPGSPIDSAGQCGASTCMEASIFIAGSSSILIL